MSRADQLAAIERLRVFMSGLFKLNAEYHQESEAYKAAIRAGRLHDAIAQSDLLAATCTADGQLPATGDAELDGAIERFAQKCSVGWRDTAGAFRAADKVLLKQAEAERADSLVDYQTAKTRMDTLSQQLSRMS